MAGKSRKQMHPAMVKVLALLECESLADASRKTDIPIQTYHKWAYEGHAPSTSESGLRLAAAAGLPLEQLVLMFRGRMVS